MNSNVCFSGITDYNTQEELKQKYNKQYRENNKEQKQQYCKINKDKIRLQNQQYYQYTKEIKNEKNICECGGKYTNQNKAIHFKSKKHQNYLANLKDLLV